MLPRFNHASVLRTKSTAMTEKGLATAASDNRASARTKRARKYCTLMLVGWVFERPRREQRIQTQRVSQLG